VGCVVSVQSESAAVKDLEDQARGLQVLENATDQAVRRYAELRHSVESFIGTPLPVGEELPQTEAPRYLTQPDMERLMLERPPFFFVERAVAFGQDTVFGLARMSVERSAGHFPTKPIVPLIELCKAMAQVGIVLTSLHAKSDEVPIAIGAGESKALAKELVVAPVDLLLKVRLQASRLGIFIVDGSAYVDGRKIGTLAKIVYTLLPRQQLLG
jgi:3-hydroxymyristoyl/3-hydroxydecanoyl-(acyl carrier protein) dehydratase